MADVILTILFFMEMMLKIVTFGLVRGEKAYLRDAWNRMDCFIVIISMLNLVGSSEFKFFKGLRALRGLRPLRLVSRYQNMRIVINSIFAAAPALLNAGVVLVLFFFIFAIVGVQFFKGKLARCETIEKAVLLYTETECS